MNARQQSIRVIALITVLLAAGSLALSGVPSDDGFFPSWASSAPHNRPLSVLDTDSALGRRSLEPKTLTLRDVARVHGHLCDGLVTAWVELGVALRTLFADGVVDRTDVRAVSKNGPCWADAAAWTTGARMNHGTLALDNTVGDGFILQRMSTRVAVQVSLKAGVVPQDFVELERSIRSRAASGASIPPRDIDQFERLARLLSQKLLTTPPEAIVRLEVLRDFSFPATSRDPIAPRSDIINRDRPRESAPAGARTKDTR